MASNIAGAKIEHSSTKCSVKTQGFFLLSLQHHNNGLENIYVFHCSLFNSVPKNILGFKKQCRGICTSCIHYGTNRLIIKKNGAVSSCGISKNYRMHFIVIYLLIIKKWCSFFLWNFQELLHAFYCDILINNKKMV